MPAYVPMPTGTVSIPLQNATARVRYEAFPLSRQHTLDAWPSAPMVDRGDDWYECDLNTLGLDDGTYEYLIELRRADGAPILVPDPSAREIDKFAGYRGVFHIVHGKRADETFDWAGEIAQPLPENNRIVIYELPIRWVDAGSEPIRQVGLGTFEKAEFEHLDDLVALGFNAIELLPIQDSPDTLNWGYGTRFFWATDYDMGPGCDFRSFVKACHQRGVRVLLDVVMNHSRQCPLELLAHDWYYLRDDEEPERQAWGGQRFRFANKPNAHCTAHEFLCRMAEFWVSDYHVDGFRIDEFHGIDNWDFVRELSRRARAAQPSDRPFIVIAEDSGRDRRIVQGGLKAVDSMWNFDFHDDLRSLLRNALGTTFGQPGRTARVQSLLSGSPLRSPDDGHEVRMGFGDLSQAINYFTSHDVESSPRLMSWLMSDLLGAEAIATNLTGDTRALYDEDPTKLNELLRRATEIAFTAWALTLTSVGIPMALAGEEFLDVHDVDPTNWRLKMSDSVDWNRARHRFRADFRARVAQLVRLRTSCGALQRNEIEFLFFGPRFDANDGERSLVYCRTGGRALGGDEQVVVFSNLLAEPRTIEVPWPWPAAPREEGGAGGDAAFAAGRAVVALQGFGTRVFVTAPRLHARPLRRLSG